MHISTKNISQTVTDMANIAIAKNRKLHTAFSFTYLHLTLTHYKG